MKISKYLCAVMLFLFATCVMSCKEKRLEYGVLPEPSGYVNATINDQPWSTAFGSARYINKSSRLFSLGSETYVNGFKAQFFGIVNVSLDSSFQKVYSIGSTIGKDLAWSTFSNSEGDVTLNGYQIADNVENNFVTVDSYDPATNKVKGRFNLTMYRDHNAVPTPGFEDTLIIKDGTYDVTLTVAP